MVSNIVRTMILYEERGIYLGADTGKLKEFSLDPSRLFSKEKFYLGKSDDNLCFSVARHGYIIFN